MQDPRKLGHTHKPLSEASAIVAGTPRNPLDDHDALYHPRPTTQGQSSRTANQTNPELQRIARIQAVSRCLSSWQRNHTLDSGYQIPEEEEEQREKTRKIRPAKRVKEEQEQSWMNDWKPNDWSSWRDSQRLGSSDSNENSQMRPLASQTPDKSSSITAQSPNVAGSSGTPEQAKNSTQSVARPSSAPTHGSASLFPSPPDDESTPRGTQDRHEYQPHEKSQLQHQHLEGEGDPPSKEQSPIDEEQSKQLQRSTGQQNLLGDMSQTSLTDLSGTTAKLDSLLRGTMAVELFTGSPLQDARRFLGRFQDALDDAYSQVTGGVPPKTWLTKFNGRLDGDAAIWADEDPQVSNILSDDHIYSEDAGPTAADIATVRRVFLERWKKEPPKPRSVWPQLETLKQGQDETLSEYYRRASTLLRQASGGENVNNARSAIASTLLSMTKEKFVTGLNNKDLQLEMIKSDAIESSTKSLKDLMEDVESCQRRMDKGKKIMEDIAKDEELKRLRELASRSAATPPPRYAQSGHANYGSNDARSDSAPPAGQRQVRFQGDQQQGARGSQTTGTRSSYQQDSLQVQQQQRAAWERALEAVRVRYSDFDPYRSTNPYVRGDSFHRLSRNNPLCTGCGNTGHISTQCDQTKLSKPETDLLWKLVNIQRDAAREAAAARDATVSQAQPPPPTAHTNVVETYYDPTKATDTPTAGGEIIVDVFNGESDQPATKRTRVDGSEDQPQITLTCEHKDNPEPACVQGKCEHQCCKTVRRKAALKSTRVPRQKKPQQPIVAMLDKSPINIRDMLMDTKVTLPFAHLCQLSPHCRDEVKRLLSQPRRQRKQKTTTATTGNGDAMVNAISTELDSEVLQSVELWKSRDRATRAFSLPAKVWRDNLPDDTPASPVVNVARNAVAADQGSDINLIYSDLTKHLGLTLLPVSQLGLPPVTMTIANGSECLLEHWVHLYVSVEGIVRHVWAFACPTENKGLSLLLGTPYLSAVNADISISTQTITIGDSTRGEARVTVHANKATTVSARIHPPVGGSSQVAVQPLDPSAVGVSQVQELSDDDEEDSLASDDDAEDYDDYMDEEDDATEGSGEEYEYSDADDESGDEYETYNQSF